MPAAAAAIVIFVCLFSHLGAIGLVGPDEPRYAWIARDMAATGDWVTPHLYGRPWFEKPALYYWAAAVGFDLHFPAEWASRLPSALAALLAALALGWLGWKIYGTGESLARSPALLAPILFSTCVGVISLSRAAGPDMIFSASLALAMASGASVLLRAGALRGQLDAHASSSTRDSLSLAMFGAFLGLAVLAKGPAGVVLAGGAIGMWALASAQWRAAFRLAHPIAIGSFAVVALPWYVICARRNPDFIRVFIFQHNFERYMTNEFQHRQPFWFFVPIVLVALLPWTALFFGVAKDGLRIWRKKSWHVSPAFFFACWAVFPVLFFSFSQSKLPGYVLPSVPPACLVLAIALAPRLQQARERRTTASIALTVFLVVCAVEYAGLRVLPDLDRSLSPRSEVLAAYSASPDQIRIYRIPRALQFGLNFYLQRELPEWSPADSGTSWVFTTQAGADELGRTGREVIVIGASSSRELLVQLGPPKP